MGKVYMEPNLIGSLKRFLTLDTLLELRVERSRGL